MAALALAYDRSASVRRYDRDGRLHIESAVLSAACVSGYKGAEINGWQGLGLKPDRVYPILRPPEELARAKATFNNLPVLTRHVPVDALNHHPELVVGSTGTDAAFDGTSLTNSLVLWSSAAIAGVESGRQRDLSCGYRWQVSWEPGTFRGERFAARMTALCGNHLALVPDGRVPGATIGDAAPALTPLQHAAQFAPGILKVGIGAYPPVNYGR
jgi:uncharacterized protein